MLGFAVSVVESFPISYTQSRLGVIKFSNSAVVSIRLDEYLDEDSLKAAIENLKHEGGETNIADGLRKTREEFFRADYGDRQGVINIAILITDGRSNIDQGLTQEEADLVKAMGIEVFTIGITLDVDESELKQIASDPDNTHYFFVDEFYELQSVLTNLINNVCTIISDNPYYSTASPSTPSTPSRSTPSSTPTSTRSSTFVSTPSSTSTPVSTTRTTITPLPDIGEYPLLKILILMSVGRSCSDKLYLRRM